MNIAALQRTLQGLHDFGSVLSRALLARLRFYRARKQGLPGELFFRFGQQLGWKAWRAHGKAGILLVNPVSITRFFEFDFAKRMIEQHPNSRTKALDLSSPFLMSLYAVDQHLVEQLTQLNPDEQDLAHSESLAKLLGLGKGFRVQAGTESDLFPEQEASFDLIWSLSVIEHILTESGDERDSLKRLWSLLAPGGRLILTVPVDQTFWNEYRQKNTYRNQTKQAEGYFFQRFYDEAAINERIIQTLGQAPEVIEWFGEIEEGRFHRYIQSWMEQGVSVTFNDPMEISQQYRSFPSFDAMPGAGVCGLCFHKPLETDT